MPALPQRQILRPTARVLCRVAGVAAAAYAARVATTWWRYGRLRLPPWAERDVLLDCFMPYYEIAERHHVTVQAPAAAAFAAACRVDLERIGLVRGLFRARARLLGASPDTADRPRGLLDYVQAIGWRVLFEQPGSEIVVGAVTRPWDADVVFRPIAPEQFAMFDEPGYVKIAWTLRVEPIDERRSIVRTETRALATDVAARRKFRRYWAIFSPGIVLIRRAALAALARELEVRGGAAALAVGANSP